MMTTIEKKMAVRQAVAELVAFCDEACKAEFAKRHANLEPHTYELDGGRRYLRIVATRGGGGGRSVHCFVDAETGDVYKAATLKAPALNGARYNLLDVDSLADLHARWDFAGAYLYKR